LVTFITSLFFIGELVLETTLLLSYVYFNSNKKVGAMSRQSQDSDTNDAVPPIPPIPQLSELLDLEKNSVITRQLDHYGFFLDSEDASLLPPKAKTKLKETEREWISILDNWEYNFKRKKTRVMRG
jgi:hypothetical protein